MKPVVLLLSTYPFVEQKHGGQVRLANIAKAFEVAGWQVDSIAVFEPEGYGAQRHSKSDLPFPLTSKYRLFNGRRYAFTIELLAGLYAAADDGVLKKVIKRLPKRIDAIHVEQPWMWPLATKIKGMIKDKDVILIYGSQNIEAALKDEILTYRGISNHDDAIVAIDALERRAAQEADLVIAVTQADLDVLDRYGAKQLLIAPNGIAPWFATEGSLNKWRMRLPGAPWLLYIASAHPPNFEGFNKCIGDSLGCIPPNSKLVVAGSVSEHIYKNLAATRWHSLNLSRFEPLGFLPDEDLSALKTLAHAYLLPIDFGGGSNIKMAEALYSGAYVIGTEAAFRGHEKFINLPEAVTARTPQEFHSAIRDVLHRPAINNSNPVEGDIRANLRWDHCLAPLPEAVTKMIGRGGK